MKSWRMSSADDKMEEPVSKISSSSAKKKKRSKNNEGGEKDRKRFKPY